MQRTRFLRAANKIGTGKLIAEKKECQFSDDIVYSRHALALAVCSTNILACSLQIGAKDGVLLGDSCIEYWQHTMKPTTFGPSRLTHSRQLPVAQGVKTRGLKTHYRTFRHRCRAACLSFELHFAYQTAACSQYMMIHSTNRPNRCSQ